MTDSAINIFAQENWTRNKNQFTVEQNFTSKNVLSSLPWRYNLNPLFFREYIEEHGVAQNMIEYILACTKNMNPLQTSQLWKRENLFLHLMVYDILFIS